MRSLRFLKTEQARNLPFSAIPKRILTQFSIRARRLPRINWRSSAKAAPRRCGCASQPRAERAQRKSLLCIGAIYPPSSRKASRAVICSEGNEKKLRLNEITFSRSLFWGERKITHPRLYLFFIISPIISKTSFASFQTESKPASG